MNREQIEYVKCASDPVYYLNNYGYVFDARKQKVEKMTCFSYQEDCIDKFHAHRNNIVLKSRQCLVKDTEIGTPEGIKLIQELKKGEEVFSYNFNKKKIEIDHVGDVWKSGVKQCYLMCLENGERIEAGEKHPFYVKNKGWIQIKNIKKKNKILFFYDKNKKFVDVLDVYKTQEKETYDISVEKNNNFLANGFLTHNTGLSVITAGYVAWRLIFRKDEKILIIANDGDGAMRFLATVKQFINYTPNWLKPGDGESLIDNQKYIKLKNNSYAQAKASSPEAGRGDSLTLLVLDETAFIENADTIWMAAGLALSQTQGKCIMISTPNGTSNLYHSIWTEADKKNKNFDSDDFIPTKVHWTQNPYCSEGLEMRVDESGETHYWSPWYESECKRMQYDKVKIAQELDLSFEGSKRLAIENEIISKYEKRLLLEEYQLIEKNKIYYDYKNSNGKRFVTYETPFVIFKKYVEGHKYILSADVARGDGTDYSTIQIIDIDTLEVVAEYRSKIAPDLFAHVIYNAAMDYGEAYLVVECNSFGLATAIDLNRKMNYNRMYFSKSIQEIYVRPYDYKVNEEEIIPGFQTTSKTRPLVINNLRTHMREGALKIYSKLLINEFKTFIQKGDRPEAEKGKNDDLIFALAIGLFIRDTEYQNASTTKEMYKGMLDAIGYGGKSIAGQTFSSNDNIVDLNGTKDAGGIFFNNISENNTIDDDNDLSWLYGDLPIKI